MVNCMLMWYASFYSRLRDQTLPKLGVQLEDRPDGTSICKFMTAAEQAEVRCSPPEERPVCFEVIQPASLQSSVLCSGPSALCRNYG